MKNKNRPYKYNSKSRLTNSNSFPFKVNNIKTDPKKSLENTLTKLHIIEEIPDETEPLDNSFFGGRVEKKEEKRKKKSVFSRKEKEKVEKSTKVVDKKVEVTDDKKDEPKIIKVEDFVEEKEVKKKATPPKKKESTTPKITFFRKMFLRLSAVCAIVLILLISSDYLRSALKTTTDRISSGTKTSSNVIDDNYLFVGGYHTARFSFDTYGLDYHYVNVSSRSLTTSVLLEDMKGNIYDYNPSVIFLELGLSDMNNQVSKEDFVSNYGRIIRYIKSNRPNATICIESIYPIRNTRTDSVLSKDITNQDILEVNSLLKDIAKDNDVLYLDIHSLLVNKGELDSKYTSDGVTLNNDGYREVLSKINNIIG